MFKELNELYLILPYLKFWKINLIKEIYLNNFNIKPLPDI